LLHPVVPLNSLDQLDFKTSLQKEIDTTINELKEREQVVQNNIRESLKKHRVSLRNHVIFIRDSLREEFDDFFNNLLSSIRKDWNLFTVQEQLIKETRRFNTTVNTSLEQITSKSKLLD
jgi:hypothetical protein